MKDRKVLELILSLLIGFYGEDFIMETDMTTSTNKF